MDKLNFYHQKRRDGGLRTGIDFNDERVLETFDLGDGPQDAALLWFVDIRCAGENLPSEPEAIRGWFLARGEMIRSALRDLAGELSAGIDSDWPLKKDLGMHDGVRMAIYCSATRRLSGREISSVLSALATTWGDAVRTLGSYAEPALANG